MLGHVAQSVGGALPGVGGFDSFVGQQMLHENGSFVMVPERAVFAFIEVQARGGIVTATSGNASAGGGASDGIFAVSSGDRIEANFSQSGGNAPQPANILLRGGQVLFSNSPAQSTSPNSQGGTGKYPGLNAVSGVPGRGGGRLAGVTVAAANSILAAGPGSGRASSSITSTGGPATGCVTFFTSYDAALAFANSLYGGNWQP